MPKRILIVEDQPVVASNYAEILRVAGFDVVGPAGTVELALGLIDKERLDGAVLDTDLVAGCPADPVAEALLVRGVPFVFVSGSPVAEPYGKFRFVAKPCRAEDLLRAAKSF